MAQAEVMRIQEEQVRLLQGRRRLQVALRRWRRGLRITRGVTLLQKKNQQTQISKCLKAWRGLVWQGATLFLLWDLREVRRVKQSFQQWRTATERHTQHKHLLLYLLFSRQHSFLQAHEHSLLSIRHHTPEQGLHEEDCSVMVSSVLLDDRRTLDELCDRLILQKTLHTWREQALNIHKARLFCVALGREHAGVLLRHWHQLAQEELSSSVLRFTTRLAQLAPTGTHTAPLDTARSSGYYSSGPLSVSMLEITAESGGVVGSHTNQSGAELSDWSLSLSHRETHCPLQASSPHHTQPADVCVADETSASGSLHPSAHRLKEVARRALARMLQPALSNTFRQWRSVTTTSRVMRRHAEFHRQTQTHTLLRRAFSTWKREMQKHETAVKHRHHTLLLHSVCVWRECVCQRRRTLALKQRAEEFRCSKLLTHSYLCWRQQCSLRPVQCNPEEEALLMHKGAWLQRSGVRRRLSWTFSLWAARVRQNRAVLSVYTHTLLSRVFVAWEVCVHSRRQRTILAQAHFERSVCVRAFRWWRSSTAQHQLACLRATHTLHTLASRCLLCWNTHTQRNREQLALLREFEAMRTRRIKSGVLLVWIEALEKHQRAQRTHYQSIMRSYLQRWQWHAQHSVCVRAVCVWLQSMREERSLRWGLRVWRGRLRLRLRRRERAWQSVGVVALVWRERALESRAQRHREERLTLLARQCLTAWRDYTESVCVERVLVCEFEEDRKMMMKSKALAVWRQMFEKRWVERYYHSRLLGGALHHWMSALIGRRRSRESALAAACVWKRKTLRSRELRERAQFQWRRRRLATIAHCFLRWSMACTHTRISQDFHRRTVCKRVLRGWQHHTEATQRDQYKEAWLQCAHEQRLLRACFIRWLEALCQAGLRHAALEQRLCQLNRWRMARSLQYWRAATRGREAHRRRSRSLLQQCFSVWRESTEELCVAECLRVERERRTAREALNTWLLWTKDQRAQRMMVDAMWIWLDGRRVSRSFHQWLRAHQRHQEASQHHNKLLLRRVFQGWQSACEDAVARGYDTLMRQVFHTWRRTALSQRAERVCLVRVCEARRRGVLRATLSIWREKAHWRVRLCEGVFSHWLQFVHRRRKVKQAQKQHKLIQRYWCVWRACVQERTSQTRLLQLHWTCWKDRTAVSLIISTMHNDSVQQRAWLAWRKGRIRSRVALSFSANLNRALLSKAFTEWRRLALHTN